MFMVMVQKHTIDCKKADKKYQQGFSKKILLPTKHLDHCKRHVYLKQVIDNLQEIVAIGYVVLVDLRR